MITAARVPGHLAAGASGRNNRLVAADLRQRIAGWRVRDVMSSPIRACSADMPLAAAADLMAAERIHCLAVVAPPAGEGEEPRFLGVLSDLDLVAALDGATASDTVKEFAGAPLESVAADATLREAVHQMRESRAHHLVVVAEGSGRPVGVLSTLDVAQALAGLGDARPRS
jgi:CBS domain-containing protein